MPLAEANVRVTLDVTKFERDLRDRVERAAQAAGRDFDRAMRRQFAATGRGAAEQFRTAARTVMQRAGTAAGRDFDVAFRASVTRLASTVGRQLGRQLQVSVGRAGIEAGNRFCDNLGRVLAQCGRTSGRTLAQALTGGLSTALQGGNTRAALTQATEPAARNAGRRAGRQFAISFDIGIGSARIGRALGTALAAITASLITDLGPVGSLLAPILPLLGAITAGALVTVVAFRGVGDAIKQLDAGNVEKLGDALRRLSPQAQAVVIEFARMRPVLRDVQAAIQDAFFGQLRGQLTAVATTLSGPLRVGLVDVATAAGVVGRNLIEAFTSVRGVDNINSLLRGTSSLFLQLTPGIRAVTDGMLDFIGASAPGLDSIGQAVTRLLTRFGQFLSRAADSGDALVWVESALAALSRLGATLGDLVEIFQILSAAARPLLFLMSDIFDILTGLARVFGSLPGPVQTLALAFLLLRKTGILEFFQRNIPAALSRTQTAFTATAGAVRQAGQAFTAASTPLQTFAQQQRQFIAAPTVFGRIRDSIQGIVPAVTSAATSITTGLGGALRSAGASLRTFGASVVAAFGGGVGLAITAGIVILTTALGLLASRQEEARRRAAEHQAAIARLVDTLDRQSGAVTQATRELVAKQLAEKGAIRTAQELGIAASDLVDASLGEAAALQRVNTQLLAVARSSVSNTEAFDRAVAALQRFGITIDDIARAGLGNVDAMAKVGAAADQAGISVEDLGITNNDTLKKAIGLAQAMGILGRDLQTAGDQARQAGDAMTPAAVAAQRYAAAVLVLADSLSSAEDKAAALNQILLVLAGDTTTVELAQARFTDVLKGLDDQLASLAEKAKESGEQIEGFGDGVIDASKRINATTQAGALLLDTFSKLTQGISDTAGAAKQYAQETGDLDGATLRVAEETQRARDQFIQTAEALGVGREQAVQLADAYGLIPALVASTVTTNGSAEQTQLQVIAVAQQLRNLPPNTPVKVQALTQEAIAALRQVGVEVVQLPDGSFTVTAKTEQAKSALGGLLESVRSIAGKTFSFIVNAITGPRALGGVYDKTGVAAMRDGGLRGRRMSARRAEIVPPNTWRIIGDRQRDDEAFIPITRSARSIALLAETARRLDFQLTPRTLTVTPAVGNTTTVEAGAITVNAPFSDPELVAKATVNELARSATG